MLLSDVSYSKTPSTRWDRIAGVALWLVIGVFLLDPLDRLIVRDCFSEACNPSVGWRLVALITVAFGISAVSGWATTVMLKRLIYREAG